MTRKELDAKCTMLICSCDAYSDCWFPFFRLLNKYWPTMSFPIVLNSESKRFEYDGYEIKTFNLYRPNEVAWGKRLRDTLKKIDTEYIFFIMDDFFLNAPVDEKKIYQCINWMEKRNRITVFSFFWVFDKNLPAPQYPGFELRKQIGAYRFNCQAAIWRRERLISALRDFEDPWEWELKGNWRSYRLIGQEFYTLSRRSPLVLNYTYKAPKQGEWDAIIKGKWLLPYVEPLFKENNIEMDFSIRGIVSEELYTGRKKKRVKVETPKKSFISYITDIVCFIKNCRHIF